MRLRSTGVRVSASGTDLKKIIEDFSLVYSQQMALGA
jgi:hypothetical protein